MLLIRIIFEELEHNFGVKLDSWEK